jgi:hypothetical protein
MSFDRCGRRRQILHGGVTAGTMYTTEQMLEKHPKTCHFLPLFSLSDELSWRRCMIHKPLGTSEIRHGRWHRPVPEGPFGMGCPETGTILAGRCSLSRDASQHPSAGRSGARIRVGRPLLNPQQVACIPGRGVAPSRRHRPARARIVLNPSVFRLIMKSGSRGRGELPASPPLAHVWVADSRRR